MIARDFDRDVDQLAEHYGEFLSREAIETALRYEQLFPEVIEAWLSGNERIARALQEQQA